MSGHPGLLPLRRETTPQEDRDSKRRRAYSIVRFTPDYIAGGSTTKTKDKYFPFPGDHLTVLEVIGSDTLTVRLGSARDSSQKLFIPIRQGRVLKREFEGFYVRAMSLRRNSLLPTIEPSALFGVSYGPLVDFEQTREYGIRSGPFAWAGTATTAGVDMFANMGTIYPALATFGFPAVMKYGGTLWIKNLDMANTLYVYMGDNANAFNVIPGQYPTEDSSMEIEPRDEKELRFECMANTQVYDTANGAGIFKTLYAACSAGTCKFKVTASRFAIDGSEPESQVKTFRVDLE